MKFSLNIICLGEGLVMHGVAERARLIGHKVSAILDLARDDEDLVAPFIAGHPCDLILSVANRHILKEDSLLLPRLGAINYHNGPLPAYAGLRATAWAIANQEKSHGIVWHRMASAIDTGAILARRNFAILPDDTTETLNARCTFAAIESLDEVLTGLAHGAFPGDPQPAHGWSYFDRRDLAPNAGVIDRSWSADQIAALVRACSWGPAENDFGTVSLRLPGGTPAFVASAVPVAADLSRRPGEILEIDGLRVVLGCGDGVVELHLREPISAAVGDVVAIGLARAETRRYRDAVLAEARWIAALSTLASIDGVADCQVPHAAVQSNGGADVFLRAVVQVLGREAVVAVQAEGNENPLLHAWRPVRGAGLDPAIPPPPRDIHLRRRGLAECARWPERAAAFVATTMSPPAIGSRAIVHTRDGRIFHRDSGETARAVAAAMRGILAAAPPIVNEGSVPRAIIRMAKASPGAPAIEEGERRVTRGELVSRARAIARSLVESGVRPGDGVGIAIAASTEFVAAALGAMIAGAAFVPFSVEGARARRLLEIAEAGVTAIVTTAELAAAFHDLSATVIVAVADWRNADVGAQTPVAHGPCAYRIFTSGTSGRPKAVEIGHSALANLSGHMRLALPLAETDRMTMLAATTFDASVADCWPILAAGGVLLIPPADLLRDLSALRDWLVDSRPTFSFVPTAVAERLIEMPWPRTFALKALLTGGDTLVRRPPAGTPFALINTYGPTENTVDSLWAVVEPGEGIPPIGYPIGGVTAEVVDALGRPCKDGEPGELVLGGAQVAIGYRGRPRLTRERFEVDPRLSAGRRYRSGDRARRAPNGEFTFLGRLDRQVQLRGVRVEPGEIEAIVKTDSRVAEAACVAERRGHVVSGLILYLVPREASDTDLEGDMRVLLAERLPRNAVPRRIVTRATLPYTPAGKIDRRELEQSTPSDPTPLSDLPLDDPLASLWSTATKGGSLSDDIEFWDLGGDSLGAMVLLLEVERATGVRVSIGDFLSAPTFAGLCTLIAKRSRSTIVRLREGVGAPIVCWYGLTGDLDSYRHLANLECDRPLIGILSPGLHAGGRPPASIEDAALAGLKDLEAAGLDRIETMVGFSWGGLLAFEAARQLTARGLPPQVVGLIGAVPPWRTMSPWRFALNVFGRTPTVALRVMLGRQRPPSLFGWSPPKLPARAVGGIAASAGPSLADRHLSMWRAYRPSGAAVAGLVLFREVGGREHRGLSNRTRHEIADYGWSELAGGPARVVWVEARDHIDLVDAVSSRVIHAELTRAGSKDTPAPRPPGLPPPAGSR